MLLQTNSYIVPKEKRSEHARLLRKFRQTLLRLGCDHFEVYEQVGANWSGSEATGRFVQIMRFRDRKHQQQVQAAEKNDPTAQQLIAEFCALINFPYQQQQGLFAVGFYRSGLPIASRRKAGDAPVPDATTEAAPAAAGAAEGEREASPAEPPPTSEEPPAPEPVEGGGASLLDLDTLGSADGDNEDHATALAALTFDEPTPPEPEPVDDAIESPPRAP